MRMRPQRRYHRNRNQLDVQPPEFLSGRDSAGRRAEGKPGDCRPSGTVAGVRVGCFPDLYGALSGDPPDQVITL